MRFLLVGHTLLLPIASLAVRAPQARAFQRLDNCRFVANRFNDGDSFHVLAESKEWLFRLYFVDTPEAETAYRDRLDEQAAYFGVTRERAIEIAHEAAAFTTKQLFRHVHRLDPLEEVSRSKHAATVLRLHHGQR